MLAPATAAETCADAQHGVACPYALDAFGAARVFEHVREGDLGTVVEPRDLPDSELERLPDRSCDVRFINRTACNEQQHNDSLRGDFSEGGQAGASVYDERRKADAQSVQRFSVSEGQGALPPESSSARVEAAAGAFERVLMTAVSGALTMSIVLVTLNYGLFSGSARQTAAFFFAYYAILYVSLSLLALGAIRLLRLRRFERWISALMAGAFLLVGFVRNSGFSAFRTDIPLAISAIAAILLLAGCALLPFHRRRTLRLLVIGSIVWFLAVATRDRRPPVVDLTRLVRAPTGESFLLVGADGADWQIMNELMRRGRLPNMQKLAANGVFARLDTILPTLSPVIWTTAFTGHRPAIHGIHDFVVATLPHTGIQIRGITLPRSAGNTPLQLRARRYQRQAYEPLISRRERRVPAYWNVASAFGSATDVAFVWPTWPAEAIRGRMISDRVHDLLEDQVEPEHARFLTYPASLLSVVRPAVVAPRELTYQQGRKLLDVTEREWTLYRKSSNVEGMRLISMFETDARIAKWLVRTASVETDQILYFRLIDLASHAAMKASPLVDDHLDATPDELRKHRRMVPAAYEEVDKLIGELVAAAGEKKNIIVMSDHGFALERTPRGGREYTHLTGPPGMIIASGPAFRRGTVARMHMHDLFPLLMRLKGFPIPRDIPGTVPPFFRDGFPPAAAGIQTYGSMRHEPHLPERGKADKEELKRLRALGYLQ